MVTQIDTGTLGKVMQLVDLVAMAETPLRFSDILAQSGQPRGTLHRQLSHLVIEGLLEVDEQGGYRAGTRLLSLAARSWSRNEFRAVAEPHLQRLQEKTGETVHLAVLRDLTVVYLDKVEDRRSVRMHSQIGNASPLYCTGIGKAILSILDEERRESLLCAMTFHRFTEATIAGVAELRNEIEAVRARGHAFDLEEHEKGICCVAAPIRTRGLSPAGISITGPAFRLPFQQLEDWAPLVRDSAAAIARDMEIRLGPRQ